MASTLEQLAVPPQATGEGPRKIGTGRPILRSGWNGNDKRPRLSGLTSANHSEPRRAGDGQRQASKTSSGRHGLCKSRGPDLCRGGCSAHQDTDNQSPPAACLAADAATSIWVVPGGAPAGRTTAAHHCPRLHRMRPSLRSCGDGTAVGQRHPGSAQRRGGLRQASRSQDSSGAVRTSMASGSRSVAATPHTPQGTWRRRHILWQQRLVNACDPLKRRRRFP